MNETFIMDFRQSMRKMERLLSGSIRNDVECCGIKLNECHILMELDSCGTAAVSELTETLGMDKSILSRTVDRMVRDGYLKRSENPDDRRQKNISLTEKGLLKTRDINAEMNGKYSRILSDLNEPAMKRALESMAYLNTLFTTINQAGACCDEGEREC